MAIETDFLSIPTTKGSDGGGEGGGHIFEEGLFDILSSEVGAHLGKGTY